MDRSFSPAGLIAAIVLLLVLAAGALYGCPQYSVYSGRMRGQAELAQAQGNRMALVAQATAENDAAVQRAEAASRRVEGWVKAAKEGCAALGRTESPAKQQCEDMLIKDNLTFSVAHEGGQGVTLIIGSPANVSVPAAKAGD